MRGMGSWHARGDRPRGAAWTAATTAVMVAALVFGLAAPAGASAPVSPEDAAATSTYLTDINGFAQMLVAETPKSAAALSEALRTQRQAGDLTAELVSAMSRTYLQPDEGAAALLITSLNTLQWSNPALTAAVRAKAAAQQEVLETPAPDVCADMRAWVAADYKTLPA